MRSDADFIKELRDELKQAQITRASYIKAKLAFLVGIFSIGALSLKSSIQTEVLLYIVPLVVLIYDLYICSEDFGIKRIGAFISDSPGAPPEEQLWESKIGLKREIFRFFGGTMASITSIVSAAILISFQEICTSIFVCWLIMSVVIISLIVYYPFFQKSKIAKYKTALDNGRIC